MVNGKHVASSFRSFRSLSIAALIVVVFLALLFSLGDTRSLAQGSPQDAQAPQGRGRQAAPAGGNRRQYNIKSFHILGNLYYIGLSDYTMFLIRSNQGYFMLDYGTDATEPDIRQNIASLGVDLKDIKFLLQSHAHSDHIGGLAKFKASTGGQVVVMSQDAAVLADGGASDYRGNGRPSFTPMKADRVVQDGEKVTLGDVTLVAHLTPAHTKGCTSWSEDTIEAGKKYNVVFICSMRMNENIPLLNNPKYPNLVSDFQRGFKTLRSLRPDLFFVSHGNQFDFVDRLARTEKGEGFKAFMDGYAAYLDEYEGDLTKQIAVEQAGGPLYAIGPKPLPPCPQDGRKCF